jgi:uncharacterized membrane protein
VEAWYSTDVLGLPVYVILWLFLLYSCAGVLVEGVFCLVLTGRLELRLGLLYLPLRPIYGLGGAACTLLLTPLLGHPVLVFALSVVICSAVEFIAGWAVERGFRTISWDYADKPLNLRGRICLQYSLAWGLLATAALYGCHSLVLDEVAQRGPWPGEALLTALLVLTLVSVVLTLATLSRVRRRVDWLRANPGREPVAAASTSWDRLVDRLVPDRVLINSFPRMGLSAELQELTSDRSRAELRSSRERARSGGNPVDGRSFSKDRE